MSVASRSVAWLTRAGVVLMFASCGASAVHAVGSWEGADGYGRSWREPRITDAVVAGLLCATGAVALAYRQLCRKRGQEAEAAGRQWRAALEYAADGFLAVGEDERIAFASPQIAAVFGYASEALEGQQLTVLLPRRAPASARSLLEGSGPEQPALDAGGLLEVVGRCKDGSEITLESRKGAPVPVGGRRFATPLFLRDITRSKQTRELLCAKEASLRLVVEQMPAILWTTNTQLQITSTLGSGLAALKMRPQDIIGMSMLECLERDNVEATPIAAHIQAVRGESLSYEMTWKGRTFQVRVDPLRKPSQKIIGTVGILLDVTDRKQALAELKARERQQAAVAALGLGALTGLGLPALMKDAAAAVSQTLEVEFCQVLELCPEEKELRVRAAAGSAAEARDGDAAEGAGPQATYTLRAGKAVVVEDLSAESRFRVPKSLTERGLVSGASTVIRGKHGALGVLVANAAVRRTFGRDDLHFLQAVANVVAAAMERRRAEEEKNRLVAILEATPDVVAIADKDQRLSYVNRAGRKVLGLSDGEDASRYGLADLYPGELRGSVLADGVQKAVAKGVWSGESALQSQGGKQIPVSQVMLSHRRPGGSVQFLSTVARDLSERQILEEQFRQAQKMEAVGQLAGGVAHDFNNLLCIITGYSGMLLQCLPKEGPSRGYAAEIERAGERAASLTRQLLAFSRKQMLVPRTLNLNALVMDMDKMLRRLIGEDVELVTVLDAMLAPVRADPGQLEQIVMNLAVNSRDAMPRGGKLTLSTANAVLDAESLRGRPEVRPGPYVLLGVTDTGCGMSKEVQARLFEPFFTTKPVGKGTGLGLATVYGIVKQSGGHLDVESEAGQGTTFRVYLPCADDAARAVEPEARPEAVPGGTETVLLVEDEDGVRSLARQVLQQKGYSVVEACDGAEALAICEQTAGRIDLLLTDAIMPNLSGGALSQRVRALRPSIKVLFMSGFTDSALVRHGVTTGEVDCLLKPFSPVDLAEAVRDALDAGSPAAAAPGEERRPTPAQMERRFCGRRRPSLGVQAEYRADGADGELDVVDALVDLANDGAGLVIRQAAAAGDQTEVVFNSPGAGGSIRVCARVVWASPLTDGRTRVGLQFVRRLSYVEFLQLT